MLKKKKERETEEQDELEEIKIVVKKKKKKPLIDNFTISIVIPSSVVDNAQVININIIYFQYY